MTTVNNYNSNNNVVVLSNPVDKAASIYIVGTAHFSKQSQDDVIETIKSTSPSTIFLELCSNRSSILTFDEESLLKEASNLDFQKIRHLIKANGLVQGLLHICLLQMSAHITRKLGMAPGGEFRVAVRQVQGTKTNIVLGDRPIHITLSRALSTLSLKQKLQLGWQFMFCSSEDITSDDVESLKQNDIIDQMLAELKGQFPSITRVFVQERDIYLAHSLWLVATQHYNAGGNIVAVVGKGHLSGMLKYWGHTSCEQIEIISRIPPKNESSIVKKGIKLIIAVSICYGTWRMLKMSPTTNKFF